MAEVLKFERPSATAQKPKEEWVGDEAVCIGCRHQWVAVSPVGTQWLECPSCSAMKGIYRKPFGAAEGDSVFTCNNCESEALTAYYHKQLFYLRCMSCGTDHTDAILG